MPTEVTPSSKFLSEYGVANFCQFEKDGIWITDVSFIKKKRVIGFNPKQTQKNLEIPSYFEG